MKKQKMKLMMMKNVKKTLTEMNLKIWNVK